MSTSTDTERSEVTASASRSRDDATQNGREGPVRRTDDDMSRIEPGDTGTEGSVVDAAQGQLMSITEQASNRVDHLGTGLSASGGGDDESRVFTTPLKSVPQVGSDGSIYHMTPKDRVDLRSAIEMVENEARRSHDGTDGLVKHMPKELNRDSFEDTPLRDMDYVDGTLLPGVHNSDEISRVQDVAGRILEDGHRVSVDLLAGGTDLSPWPGDGVSVIPLGGETDLSSGTSVRELTTSLTQPCIATDNSVDHSWLKSTCADPEGISSHSNSRVVISGDPHPKANSDELFVRSKGRRVDLSKSDESFDRHMDRSKRAQDASRHVSTLTEKI